MFYNCQILSEHVLLTMIWLMRNLESVAGEGAVAPPVVKRRKESHSVIRKIRL